MTEAELRLKEILEQAMEDVATIMADEDRHRSTQAERLMEVRRSVARTWKMAGFGEAPEFVRETNVKRVG